VQVARIVQAVDETLGESDLVIERAKG